MKNLTVLLTAFVLMFSGAFAQRSSSFSSSRSFSSPSTSRSYSAPSTSTRTYSAPRTSSPSRVTSTPPSSSSVRSSTPTRPSSSVAAPTQTSAPFITRSSPSYRNLYTPTRPTYRVPGTSRNVRVEREVHYESTNSFANTFFWMYTWNSILDDDDDAEIQYVQGQDYATERVGATEPTIRWGFLLTILFVVALVIGGIIWGIRYMNRP